MLILTRKLSESIKIGNEVVITITQIAHGKVKLGIEAPAHVRIVRTELTENQTATSAALGKPTCATQSEPLDDAFPASSRNSPMDFSTDYAAEIEDQMLCLVSH